MQLIRRKLKEHGINESWAALREKLSRQYRITTTFKQRDGTSGKPPAPKKNSAAFTPN